MKKIFNFLVGGVLVTLGVLFASCGSSDKVVCYTRDRTSGTRDGFFTAIGLSEAKEDNAPLRKNVVEVDSNGSMIAAIKNDVNGIGYISLSTLETSGLKDLMYEGIKATEENVLNGTYKLKRNFNYCIRDSYKDSKKEQIVEAFIAYMNTTDGKLTIKNKDGIVKTSSSDKSWSEIEKDYPICSQDNSLITIKFGGSTSVEKIARQLSEEFSKKCGNFVAEHNHTGSGDAYKRTQGSEANGANYLDIAFASREFNSSENLIENTYGFICIDAIVPVVNKNNKLSIIDANKLKQLYTGEINNWSELK